jgi:ketosteroid isomerase-like protein
LANFELAAIGRIFADFRATSVSSDARNELHVSWLSKKRGTGMNEVNQTLDAEAVARRYLAALETFDVSSVMVLVADDMIMEYPFRESGDNSPENARIIKGRNAVEMALRQGLPLEETIRFELESFTSSADRKTVFVECRGDMIMKGGRSYKNRYIFRVDVSDGKIKRVREYLNPVTAGLAFGRPIAGQIFTEPL